MPSLIDHRRDIRSNEEMFDALFAHEVCAYNTNGRIRPTVTVFAPAQPGRLGPRIWNTQLVRYAGYTQADGSIIGDSANVTMTEQCTARGWRKPVQGRFDVLPVIASIDIEREKPIMREHADGTVHEVPIEHPKYAWFAELGLKWHVMASICSFGMSIGGVDYPALVFTGWCYVGARNYFCSHPSIT